MGMMQAVEMAEAVETGETTLRGALSWHFASNLYPRPPAFMVDVALEAIELIESGESDTEITLPDGVTFRYSDTVLPWQVVDQFRLGAFIGE